jgi:hypothetical protein
VYFLYKSFNRLKISRMCLYYIIFISVCYVKILKLTRLHVGHCRYICTSYIESLFLANRMLTELRNVWVNSVNGNNGINTGIMVFLWEQTDMFFLENGLSGSGK